MNAIFLAPPFLQLRWRQVACLGLLLGFASPAAAQSPADESTAFFESSVRPLLVAKCAECHGAKKQESDLRVDSRAGLMQGGVNGPAIVPGHPDDSLLVKAMRHEGDLQMPPEETLSAEQVAVIVKWVELGAPWPAEAAVPLSKRPGGSEIEKFRDFWSFQPIGNPPLPPLQDVAWPQTSVDYFIRNTQEVKSLSPAPPADKHALLRRVTFDLTGLPPTADEVNAFVADTSPDAYAHAVDRLLASPAYGERWGRHWLDVVRYADTAGETADYPVREAWKYRNYVVAAFNKDKPYDQFIREQVAGDLMGKQTSPEQHAEQTIATGFIAVSRRFGFDSINYQHLTIQDTLDTLGQSVLGLSIGCARCHDHKYDPIAAADYYALYGIFASTRYAFPGDEQTRRPREFPSVLPAEALAAAQQQHQAQIAAIDAEIAQLNADKKPVADQLAATPEQPELKTKLAELDAKLGQLAGQRTHVAEHPPYELAYGVGEGTPQNARIQKRGEPLKLGDEVPRRFLTILGGDTIPPDEPGSGRRQLADWLTREQNPLTARVIVNRVWQRHFGEGIVSTENDFGVRGQLPTHPQLLDHLAHRLIESGWSLKTVQRLIVLSSTYQQSSLTTQESYAADPGNQWLARHSQRRLDAEEIRDSLLAVGDSLDRAVGGGHPFPDVGAWGFSQHGPFSAVYDTNLRSVYLMTQRSQRHPLLALFDGADPNASTAARLPTTAPTQALFAMNDSLVHAQSTNFARRLLAASPTVEERVRLAHRLGFGREATPEEVKSLLEFVARYQAALATEGLPADQQELAAWSAAARTLLAANEFIFID